MSVFGAGILMGTALCVIIPEGVNSIYEASSKSHHHHEGMYSYLTSLAYLTV